MDSIEDNSKKYESISLKFDPHYNTLLSSIPLIKDFIRARKLIIYGGTAIDYALRLKGSCIYPDDALAIPDLDFYSSNSIEDAYDLVDLLFKHGFTSVCSTRAMYVLTTRVDLVDNHFIADITYVNPNIFKKLPFIEYEGMRIIHPHFQYIDLHKAIASPFNNPLREEIFHREVKFIKRFSLLYSFYPISFSDKDNKNTSFSDKDNKNSNSSYPTSFSPNYLPLTSISFPLSLVKYPIFSGVQAYFIILHSLQELSKVSKIKANYDNIIVDSISFSSPLNKDDSSDIIVTSPSIDHRLDFISQKSELFHDFDEFYSSILNKYFYKQLHIDSVNTDSSSVDSFSNKINLFVYNTKHQFIAINSTKINNIRVRFVNIHFLLAFFLGLHFMSDNDDLKNTYLHFYVSCLRIIEEADNIISIIDKKDAPYAKALAKASPFYPSISVYGSDNYSFVYDILFHGILADLHREQPLNLPVFSYKPSMPRPPKFNYNSSIYFIKTGEKIPKSSSH